MVFVDGLVWVLRFFRLVLYGCSSGELTGALTLVLADVSAIMMALAVEVALQMIIVTMGVKDCSDVHVAEMVMAT